MARAVALVCASAVCAGVACIAAACSGNPYVIGRVDDAGAESGTASSSDAAAGEGAAGECTAAHQGALLCADFEASELESEWSFTDHSGDAQVERSTLRSHHGVAALRASSFGPESQALVAADLPALRTGKLHVRTHVYVPAQLSTEIMNVMFVGDADASEPFQGVDFNLEDGAAQLFSPQSSERYTDTESIPRGRWFCLRLELSIDDTAGRVRVWVDERLALETNPFDTLPDAGVNQLRVGIDWSSNQAAFFEVYFDDVVVDTEPVACGA
jgi:hypothetical protein